MARAFNTGSRALFPRTLTLLRRDHKGPSLARPFALKETERAAGARASKRRGAQGGRERRERKLHREPTSQRASRSLGARARVFAVFRGSKRRRAGTFGAT